MHNLGLCGLCSSPFLHWWIFIIDNIFSYFILGFETMVLLKARFSSVSFHIGNFNFQHTMEIAEIAELNVKILLTCYIQYLVSGKMNIWFILETFDVCTHTHWTLGRWIRLFYCMIFSCWKKKEVASLSPCSVLLMFRRKVHSCGRSSPILM